MMAVNEPSVLAEVEQAFRRYEVALVSNDVETLDALFLSSDHTIRYGITENLYGIEAIRAFRRGRPSAGLERSLAETVITCYGKDTAVASTLFHRPSAAGKVGRQMQTWIRTNEGWKVAAAHVSVIDEPS